jgi:ectoine hydroxylase
MAVLQDFYPSRLSEKPNLAERKDPVIHGDLEQGPLSAEQIESYRQNGYLALPSFFSAAETAEMQAELERVFRQSKGSNIPEVILEPESDEVRSVFAIHRTSPLFNRYARKRRLLEGIMQLLGSDLYVHQSRINFKPGFDGKEFQWHSDFETWHIEDGMPRMRALSCSIALSDNHIYNGALMLIPGSHNQYVSCVGATPEENFKSSLRKQEIGVPDRESLTWLADQGGIDMPTGPAGSIVLFDCNTMHGSSSNISPYARSNLFIVYNSVENALVEPFGGTKPRPEYIAHRRVEKLVPID